MTTVRLAMHKRWLTTRTGVGMPAGKVRTLSHAQRLQRRGLTFSEIARELGQPREAIVQSLYYDQVRK